MSRDSGPAPPPAAAAYDALVAPASPAPGVYVRFNATQGSPDFTRIFMETGGQINAAAIPWQTDFSTSGASTAAFCHLRREGVKEVLAHVEPGELKDAGVDAEGVPVVEVHPDFRVNISTSCLAPAINGTVVASVSGQGSVLLRSLLDNEHAQTGLEYKSWLAHGATVCVSGAQVVRVHEGGARQVLRVRYRESPEADAEEARLADAAVQLLNGYVHASFALREKLVYEPSPNLTKSVFRTPVGVAGEGYALVHDFVQDAQSPLSLEALNSLFKATIASDCCQDAGDIGEFIANTSVPGLKAAGEARTVASACSLIATYLTSYRSDGRAKVGTQSLAFEAAESWLHELPRSPISADDCDGSARCALGMLRTAAGISKEQAAEYEYLNAVKNVVSTYYEPALVVLGATAAEATSADASHSAIAGHAIAMLLPKISLLSALARAARKKIADTDEALYAPSKAAVVEDKRFNAFFSNKEGLPAAEKEMLSSWNVAKNAPELALEPLAIEGTTPASPVLHESVAARRDKAAQLSRKDDAAFEKLAPNAFRSIKRLHVLGKGRDNEHRFYSAFVEATFARDCPLYSSKELRDEGAAASQFVFAQNDSTVSVAGTSPKQLVDGDYVLMPLISLPGAAAQVIDASADVARRSVVAPRERGPFVLGPMESSSLRKSIALLDSLHAQMHERREGGHPIAYNVALSTLVFNPESVAAFCSVVAKQAVSCTVDKTDVPGSNRCLDPRTSPQISTLLPRAPALHKSRTCTSTGDAGLLPSGEVLLDGTGAGLRRTAHCTHSPVSKAFPPMQI